MVSALRQAAHRDEQEIALAAPLRKASDDAIALFLSRSKKPEPARQPPDVTSGTASGTGTPVSGNRLPAGVQPGPDAVMPGVVSLPHGWGHAVAGTAQAVASAQPGTNSNVLADELLLDAVSGNAVLNGIPVELAPVRAAATV